MEAEQSANTADTKARVRFMRPPVIAGVYAKEHVGTARAEGKGLRAGLWGFLWARPFGECLFEQRDSAVKILHVWPLAIERRGPPLLCVDAGRAGAFERRHAAGLDTGIGAGGQE